MLSIIPKALLIIIISVLIIFVIYKANKLPDEPENKVRRKKEAPKPEKPSGGEGGSGRNIEFFLVYVGRRTPITHFPFKIGSRNDNDLIVTDPHVSREHAELFRKNGKVYLRDCGSLNGTVVNGRECAETQIVGGETVVLGKTTVLHIERARDDVSDDTQFIRR